jgi:hypothetical protein
MKGSIKSVHCWTDQVRSEERCFSKGIRNAKIYKVIFVPNLSLTKRILEI